MAKTLSESEIRIMQIIWNNGCDLSSTDLASILESQSIDWKRSTISTFITRLCKKGLLRSSRNGRTYTYTTLLTEEEYRESQTKAFIKNMYKGNAKRLVATLIQSEFLSAEDISELVHYWNRKANGNHD